MPRESHRMFRSLLGRDTEGVWTPDKVGSGLRDYLVYRWHVEVDDTKVQLFPSGDDTYRVEVTLPAGAKRDEIEQDLKELLPAEYRLVVRQRAKAKR